MTEGVNMKMRRRTLAVIALAVMIAAVFCMPEAAQAKAKKPAKVTGVKVTATYDTVTVKWGKSKNASNYEVYRTVGEDGSYSLVAKTGKRTYKDKGLNTGTTYKYKIRGINKNRKGKMSSAVSAVPALAVPKKLKADAQADGVHLSLNGNVKGADGYVIHREGEEIADLTDQKTYVDAEIPAETSGAYSVAAYRNVAGTKVFSEYSEEIVVTRPAVSITIKNVAAPSGQLALGMSYTIDGKITANIDIRKVVVGVQSKATQEWMDNAKKTRNDYDTNTDLNKGNPRSFSILRLSDPYVHFGTLPVGEYVYKVVVTTVDGTKKTLVKEEFQIIEVEPVIVTGGAKKIVKKAKACAWPFGTEKSVYKYKGGDPTEEFQAAIATAYPNRTKWGKQTRAGASCDVFVGTVVRASKYDTTFPRGLDEIVSYMKKHTDKWKKTGISTKNEALMQPGDIIYQIYNSGTGHVCIYLGNGKIANAHYGGGTNGTYGVIETYASKVKTKSKCKKFYVYRAVK